MNNLIHRKTVLLSVLMLFILAGLASVAVAFLSSWMPTERANNNATVRISISKIPENGALEVDYLWYKAFVVKQEKILVFLIPYSDRIYYMPDPTWERPFFPCRNFVSNNDGFYCDAEYFRDEANWSINGKSNGRWMPDLVRANYVIEGNYLTLNPEIE